MTTGRPLESRLHHVIGDIARGPYPDYIDDVLAGTARRRQRPAWTFPERWPPMDIAAQPLQNARRVPWRGLALVALLILALAGALILAGGAFPRVAPPFGRAGNGVVAFAADGDIRAVDVKTGKVTTLIGGPELDRGPIFSRDGTRVVFLRSENQLFVARADGTGLVAVTEKSFRLELWGFSPDGRFVTAIDQVGGVPQILVAPSDGSAPPRHFDVGSTTGDGPPQFRADGSEIVFVGRPTGAMFRGVYAVDPTTGKVRTIVEGSVGADVHVANVSPDGSRIAYGTFDTREADISAVVHVIGADGTGDRVLDLGPDGVLAMAPNDWSNDGTRLIVFRSYNADGTAARSAVIPVDGSGPGIEIECPAGMEAAADCSGDWTWSPDDSTLIGIVSSDPAQLLAEPATGRLRPATWGGSGDLSWQRLAP
jgi:hypothetical protein